ncbi:hypothetical protein [Rhodococcoides fascians]|uniref:hypothetical protein n=1 Tax=Rhodococcoides fascians TaxID=1828 RepID=UPI0005652171|nr:hypothetical protein [Rhodococcus fascians]
MSETPVTWPISSLEHGTYKGYQKCRRRPAGVCDPCHRAAATYQKNWRIANGYTTNTLIPNELLATIIANADDQTRARINEHLTDETVEAILHAHGWATTAAA